MQGGQPAGGDGLVAPDDGLVQAAGAASCGDDQSVVGAARTGVEADLASAGVDAADGVGADLDAGIGQRCLSGVEQADGDEAISGLCELISVSAEPLRGQGRYDFVSALDPEWVNALKDETGKWKPEWKGRFKVHEVPYLKTDYVGFLVDSAALDQGGFPRLTAPIRRAMSMALDREALVRELRADEAVPAEGFVPSGMPGFSNDQRQGRVALAWHPDVARSILAEAGIGPEPPLERLGGSLWAPNQGRRIWLQHCNSPGRNSASMWPSTSLQVPSMQSASRAVRFRCSANLGSRIIPMPRTSWGCSFRTVGVRTARTTRISRTPP